MNGNILLIEDNELQMEYTRIILESVGHRVAVAPTGKIGIEKAMANPIDLILLDLMLPDMTGFDVCEKLQDSEATNNIPIIFLTAKKDDESLLHGLESGAVDFVHKPFNKQELLLRIRIHLILREREKQYKAVIEELTSMTEHLERLTKQYESGGETLNG